MSLNMLEVQGVEVACCHNGNSVTNMYPQQFLGAMAETIKLSIDRHYPLPSNSSLVLLEVAMCWTDKNLYLPNSLASRSNTDMIEEVYSKCHCVSFCESF